MTITLEPTLVVGIGGLDLAVAEHYDANVGWMMGYPRGWVTDILDRRTDALRCLGNAVVPQQALAALAALAALGQVQP